MPAEPLIFGFDIGIASVGWSVIAPDRIVALGVRAFDKAETAKEGAPLNLVRRNARLLRHRIRRRAWRMRKLARLLKREGLIDHVEFFQPAHPCTDSLWKLRVDCLDRRLTKSEWARVVYHICKHRGFHWVSRAEEGVTDSVSASDHGKVKQGLARTANLMREKQYRTVAEMVLSEFPDAQRNKYGEYTKAVPRAALADELALLFRRQRELGNSYTTSGMETSILGNGDRRSGLLWEQKPPLEGLALLKMLGHCTLERAEYRAPKASFTAERHVWLTRLNNLRIVVDGTVRPLSAAEREIAITLPYARSGDLTYRQLRTELVAKTALPDSFRFAGLPYPSEAQQQPGKPKDPESAPAIRMPGWHALRAVLKRANLESEWSAMAGAALRGHPEMLDDVAWVLSVYKEDVEAYPELARLALPGGSRTADALLSVRFDRFHSLSLKALRRIVPYMESGLRYDEACARAGYHHSLVLAANPGRFLPPLYSGRDNRGGMILSKHLELPRNPVVLRALNQARKVINALVREYGSPHGVHVEMARDLSKPYDERRQIANEQSAYRERNEADRAQFLEHFGHLPSGQEFEKWRLYREQQGKCAYSVAPLDLRRLFEPGYVEVDHVLPWSRSFDDSKNNKVLVLAKENRDKGNRIPFEYLNGDEDSERWRQFVAYVESNKTYRLAKRTRLLRRNFEERQAEEFRDRNLNDTRYVCRFFKSYVEQYLLLASGSDAARCVVVSGGLTSFLRARWGLLKVRAEGDRHHALDATVVAVCTPSLVKRLADYARCHELNEVRDGFVDVVTGEIVSAAMFQRLERHFPEPWPHFRAELEARLKIDDAAKLRDALVPLGTYPEDALPSIHPLFVSRAPQRRNGGAAHKETIYGLRENSVRSNEATQRVPLASLKTQDLESLVDPKRNERLYGAIRTQLELHGGDGRKAFPSSAPLRKPDRNGQMTGPVVRSVTMRIDNLSGIPVRGGIAKNEVMLRLDIFSKSGKFYLVPIYVHHRVSKQLPNRAIVASRDEGDWTPIDTTFDWCMSLYPNDLVQVKLRNKEHLGYYAGCDRSTGAISLWAPDRDRRVGNDGLIRGIGLKTAISIAKFDVDVLGRRFCSKWEPRRALA